MTRLGEHSRADVIKAMTGLKMLEATRSRGRSVPPAAGQLQLRAATRGAGEHRPEREQAPMILKSKLLSDEPGEADDEADGGHQFELMPEGWNADSSPEEHTRRTRAQHDLAAQHADPTVETVLAGMQDHTVRVTKKIGCARRGINPAVAKLVSHRIRHFRNHVNEINLTHNPLRMEGLKHLMVAIHDAHHIQRMDVASCELDFGRVTETLRDPRAHLRLPAMEPISGDVDGASADEAISPENDSELDSQDSNRELPDAQEQDARAGLKIVDNTGKSMHFAPIRSGNVYTWSTTSSTVGEEEEEEEEEEESLDEAEQAALRFKNFLLDQKQLEFLNMSQNSLGVGGAWLISQAAQHPPEGISQTLRTLKMSDSNLGVKGTGALVQEIMSCCKSLTSLDISNNSIRGSDACNIMEGLCNCPSLEEFHASHNAFGDHEAAQKLGSFLSSNVQNLRTMDLRFNRFTGSRLGAWPSGFSSNHSHVLRILDSLLPMLSRFDKGHDPVDVVGIGQGAKSVNGQLLKANELDSYRKVYDELIIILNQQLAIMSRQMSSGKLCEHERPEHECPDCGIFTGSVTHLLAALSSFETPGKLTSLLLGGNLMSDDITGTILHLASRVSCKTQLRIDDMRFSAVSSGDMLCIVRLDHHCPVPPSTCSASGYHVLSVEPREMILDCGLHMLDLQHETYLTAVHSLETGLRMDRINPKPKSFKDLVFGNKIEGFFPARQLTFEKEMQARIMSRTSEGPRTMPQLSAKLQKWKSDIGGIRAEAQLALATACVEPNDEEEGTRERSSVLPVARVRHIGKAPGTTTSESVSRNNTPQRVRTPPTPSYKSLWGLSSQTDKSPSPISVFVCLLGFEMHKNQVC